MERQMKRIQMTSIRDQTAAAQPHRTQTRKTMRTTVAKLAVVFFMALSGAPAFAHHATFRGAYDEMSAPKNEMNLRQHCETCSPATNAAPHSHASMPNDWQNEMILG
jgi:hypothetical protein